MRRDWRNMGRLAALVACAALIGWTTQAGAQEEGSVMVGEPTVAAESALPPPADMAAPAAEPATAIKPCIDYRTHLSARRMLRCQSQVQVVMQAQNPADCCLYEIPLCIPACCTGEPCVTSDCGLLGRGIVTYCWPCCGFEAKVVFKDCHEVKVHYRG